MLLYPEGSFSYCLTSQPHTAPVALHLPQTDSLLDTVPSHSPGFQPLVTFFSVTCLYRLPSSPAIVRWGSLGLGQSRHSWFLTLLLSPHSNSTQATTSFCTYSPMSPRISIQPSPLSTSSCPTAYLVLSKAHRT